MQFFSGDRNWWGRTLGLLLLFAALVIGGRGVISKEKCYTYTFVTMGTVAEVFFFAGSEDEALNALQETQSAFAEIIAVANRYSSDGELAMVNRQAGQECQVSTRFAELLDISELAWQKSGGAFDVTIDPLMKLWGFYRKRNFNVLPSDAEIADTLRYVGWQRLRWQPETRRLFLPKGMSLDFGGIAKGVAVDLAWQRVRSLGIKRGAVNLGGNLRFLSAAAASAKDKNLPCYPVSVKAPDETGNLLPEKLMVSPGEAVSTSGDYERFVKFKNRKFGHLIEPRTGWPVTPGYAVTVVAPDAATADWLSSALFLRGRSEDSKKMLAKVPGARAYFVAFGSRHLEAFPAK